MEENGPKPIAVTIGDPAGIGPEVLLKAWYRRAEENLSPFFVIGNVKLLEKQVADMGINIPIKEIPDPDKAQYVFKNSLPVLNIDVEGDYQFGIPMKTTASMVIGSIDKAVELVMNGEARAIATAPIQKSALYDVGFRSPGHTEYLAELSKKHTGDDFHPVMMLASQELCVVPLTIHVALEDVSGMITQELIMKTGRIIHNYMRKHFDLQFPSIAVSGLNPHAGENNAMGKQDSEIIAPAIQALKKEGIRINGPMPADTMFHKAARDQYDVALCMYHDQALIPIKTIDFDAGVNVTLGLPIVRTSPDHGTALNIAGQNLANPTSMINSLKLADRMTRNAHLQEASD